MTSPSTTAMFSGKLVATIVAIAFATAICNGHEPASIVFDQPRIRRHLMVCLSDGALNPFPERSRKRERMVKMAKKEKLSVYCICRLPDSGDLMIQCAKCKTWYHETCIQVSKSFLSKNVKMITSVAVIIDLL